jgi:hypothetical protein
VIIRSYGGEVGIGKFVISNICTVNLELELIIIVKDRHSISPTRSQILDWVVEIQLLDLGSGGDRLLGLGDEHVLGLGSEHLTLLGIEVRIVRVDIPLVSGRRGAPSDSELDIVVLERNEWKSSLPVLTESKAEGVEPVGCATIGKISGNRLGSGSRRQTGSNEGRVCGILFINHLTPHKEFNLGNFGQPLGLGVSLGSGTIIGNEVDISEHVTLALEADGRHTVVRDVALNDLTLDSLGKICMTLVGGAEEAHLGLTDEVYILGSDGYELGNTTRHFII